MYSDHLIRENMLFLHILFHNAVQVYFAAAHHHTNCTIQRPHVIRLQLLCVICFCFYCADQCLENGFDEYYRFFFEELNSMNFVIHMYIHRLSDWLKWFEAIHFWIYVHKLQVQYVWCQLTDHKFLDGLTWFIQYPPPPPNLFANGHLFHAFCQIRNHLNYQLK